VEVEQLVAPEEAAVGLGPLSDPRHDLRAQLRLDR